MRHPVLLAAFAALAAAACGEAVRDDHFANKVEPAPAPADAPVRHVVPVRIGELGVSFDACAAAGTTRRLKAGEGLPVREAPFDSARETASIPAGKRFFVCSRSHDQKWLGVVFGEGGVLAEACGVSSPVTSRRDYAGPCRSGWVASAFVRTVAGVEQPPAAAEAETNRVLPGRSGG